MSNVGCGVAGPAKSRKIRPRRAYSPESERKVLTCRDEGDLHLQSTCTSATGAGSHVDRLRQPGYRYRRMCTLWTRPNIAKNVTNPEPPYEMNGRGRPVTGMTPSVIATFWKTCHRIMVNTPAHR